ncbi:hypothetical protein FEMY_14790 [Ferrovum myxofaciens]|uniref:Uncharacterized protein n=1 Tax=Ferrovum myxofaciens TaxID=416213 RepID=A0A149VXM9_9PROT|nr:hypothetical protein FEMY_14790 [Ferrovum myxofaciens]
MVLQKDFPILLPDIDEEKPEGISLGEVNLG